MKMEMIIRRFAGTFILGSLLLAHYHSPYWLWFTAFVGFNLVQSTFTGFCPLEMILKKCGVGGIFHTDELPAYGVTAEEVAMIRAHLKAGEKDCVEGSIKKKAAT